MSDLFDPVLYYELYECPFCGEESFVIEDGVCLNPNCDLYYDSEKTYYS